MDVTDAFAQQSWSRSGRRYPVSSEEDAGSRVYPVMSVVLTLLFVVVIPIALLQNDWGQMGPALLIQAVVTALAGGMLARTIAMRRPALMQTVVYLFTYIWMGLAPLAQHATGVSPLPAVFPTSQAFSASLLTLVGLLAYIVGSHIPSTRTAQQTRLARVYQREILPGRVAAMVVIAIVLFFVFVPALGGIGTFFSSRQQVIAAKASAVGSAGGGAAATQLLESWALSASAVWALLGLVLLGRHKSGRTGWWWTGLSLMIALNVVVSNPISRPRYWAGTVLIGLAFSLPRLRRGHGYRVAALGLVALVLIVFPYADYFRYKHPTDQHVVSVTSALTTNNYDAFPMTEAGLVYVKAHGHGPTFLLTDALFFVPRYLWSGKAADTGAVVSNDNNFTLSNRSTPLWLESYLWGGAGATIAVFLLLGLGHRRLDDAHGYTTSADSPQIGPAFVPVLGVFALFYLRGPLLPAMAPLSLLILLPILMSRRQSIDPTSALHVPAASTESLTGASFARVNS